MNIHHSVFWVGFVMCVAGLSPILLTEHLRALLYEREGLSFLVGRLSLFALIVGILLTFIDGRRGILIYLGSFVGLGLLGLYRFGPDPVMNHPGLLWSLALISFVLSGGVSLLAIAVNRESIV